MRWPAFRLAKQYQGRPRRQLRHVPHGARQAITTVSPGWMLPRCTAWMAQASGSI